MNSDDPTHDPLPALWDALAGYPAAEANAACEHLMRELKRLLHADNVFWCAVVRMNGSDPTVPLGGWRVRAAHLLHTDTPAAERMHAHLHRLDKGNDNQIARRGFAEAGQFRIRLLSELMGPEWFASDYYLQLCREHLGFADFIWAGAPINADAEAGICLLRTEAQPRFGEAERELFGQIMRPLRWFQRLQLLAHGLALADAPLTATEQRVLKAVLQGKRDKQIAADLGQSPHTTYDHVRNLLHKFGVGNRTELLALWLGQTPPERAAQR